MTSRERIMQALSHKEPDKIPVDCGAMRSTGFSAKMYYDFKKFRGKQNEGHIKVYDMVQQLSIPEDWFINDYQIDALDFSRFFADDDEDWYKTSLPDGTPVLYPKWIDVVKKSKSWVVIDKSADQIAKMPQGSYFFDQSIFPYYGDNTDNFSNLKDRMQKVMWVSMTDPMWRNALKDDFYIKLRKKAKFISEHTDKAVVVGFGGQLFEMGCFLYRNDEFMINLMINRKRIEKMLDMLTEIYCDNLEKLVKAIKGYVDIIVLGDDLGTQSAPMLDPQVYREVFIPRLKKIISVVKNNSEMKIFFHSCGAVSEFISDLIDVGVDILNPVQTTAKGMVPVELKKNYGKDIVFWGGGIDTQNILRTNSPSQIKDEVRRNCEVFMKEGGYIFNQIHNMLPGIPPENIEAMYESVNSIKY